MNPVVLAQLLAIALVVVLVALAFVTIPVHRGGPPIRTTGKEPRGWSGYIYRNPDDPALFVPKRLGVGWTVNFGHPWAWRVIALPLVAVALGISIVTVSTAR